MKLNINNTLTLNNLRTFAAITALALMPGLAIAQDSETAEQIPSEVDKYEQKVNSRIAIGLRASHLYDMKFTAYDRIGVNTDGNDVWGLNGDNTSFDLAFGLDISYFFSPFFSMDFSYDAGSMTGANEREYSQADVSFYNLGANFNLKRAGLKEYYRWVPYARLSTGIASFDATRFLAGNNGELRTESADALNIGLGLGLRYHINDNFHLNLASEFRTVFNDGFDGYDYGSGRDQMLQTTLGIRYTFGKGKHADRKAAWRDARVDALTRRVTRQLKDYNDTIAALQQGLIKLEDLTAEQIANLKKKQDVHSDEIEALKDANKEKSNATSVQAYSIFFGFNQWNLTANSKKELMPLIAIMKADPRYTMQLSAFTDKVGTDKANEKVREKRINGVKEFLVSQGIEESRIQIAEWKGEYNKDAFLDRRVDVVIR